MKDSLKIRTFVLVLFIVACNAFSLRAVSIEAMSESDLDEVSAIAGNYLLDIFGAPAAGLSSGEQDSAGNLGNDNDSKGRLKQELLTANKAAEDLSDDQVRLLEDDTLDINELDRSFRIDEASFNESAELNKQIISQSDSKTSNSEIKFKQGNVSHVMQELKNGGITVTRDLRIDQLKIENLRFNERADSAGSIYLSDWRSEGSTQMVIRN